MPVNTQFMQSGVTKSNDHCTIIIMLNSESEYFVVNTCMCRIQIFWHYISFLCQKFFLKNT